MYRNKKEVDKYVENLIAKHSAKEFNNRAYSVARLYFDVGDYANCQKYVEQYLAQKNNNAAAYKLLGQSLQKLGQKDKALEHYKKSLEIDPAQTNLILDICELLADVDVSIEPGRANYWCEKAEAIYPGHSVTFRLRERLVTLSNSDPEALVKLLRVELNARPKDAALHVRLLRHYINTNNFTEAFQHSFKIEFSSDNFVNNYSWYETLDELLKYKHDIINDWQYQLLWLTVKERLCVLSLTEIPSGPSKSLVESCDLLQAYDQALEIISKTGPQPKFVEFHTCLLQQHRGQLFFHLATYLLKKAKKNQIPWQEAIKTATPLVFLAWQTVPLDPKVKWLKNAPETQTFAVNRWYTEATYRCSQSGHFLISNYQDNSQSILDQVSQCCSGTHWKDKLYEKIFTNESHMRNVKTSYFVLNAYNSPVIKFPRRTEVIAYDEDAQRMYGNSLHHFVWVLLNYKNFADFKCTIFEMLNPNAATLGPETLNKFDIYAFLYCATFTSQQRKSNEVSYVVEKPSTLPANITDLLCSLPQMKWWDCAYKYSHNVLGTQLTDVRATLSRGIEVVRCIDNHGLDPELLCKLGRLFSELGQKSTLVEEQLYIEKRTYLYFSSAIPLLEKLKSKTMIKVSDKRMFDYTQKEVLNTREVNTLLEECKLSVAVYHLNENEYEKVIELLVNIKTPHAYYHLANTYKKIASEEKNVAILEKAKKYAYKALDALKETESHKTNSLYSITQDLIEDIEISINKMDPDSSGNFNYIDAKSSSDENISYRTGISQVNRQVFRNISSTPKANQTSNNTNYKSAIDSQLLDITRHNLDQQHLERIENEIKKLQKRDTHIDSFMDQTKNWFEENSKLGNQIISTINTNIQNTTDQFKQLKISVDQVKDQIDECRNECKDVGELKKQVAELKKEVNKLKKASTEQTINENDLYNLDDEFRTNDSSSTYTAQLPFAPQVLPPFNQRPPFPIPPNPYQLYNQSLYNLYNQYTQFAQSSSVPAAPQLFDPTRAQMNYASVYQNPEQMYLDVGHLIPPAVPVPPAVPTATVVPQMPIVTNLPVLSTLSSAPTISATTLATSTFKANATTSMASKDTSKPLPVNVVITSSDPLPTSASTPAPILSVTIPQKHIKGTPHNYQIAMPTVSDTKITPPIFSFTMPDNKSDKTNASPSVSNWKQAFQTFNPQNNSFDNSITVVDGPFGSASPNTSLNKSRTLSEKSNTSVDYDPCPDFKPIVPLPAEVKVTTGEEDESIIFSSRAKLFRFADKQWKERGVGEIKLLKHKETGKVRVLMRREQVHKICANHIINSEMEIKPMKNETKAYMWAAHDFADETIALEKFCIRFKTAELAQQFFETFEKARLETTENTSDTKINIKNSDNIETPIVSNESVFGTAATTTTTQANKTVFGGFTFSKTPLFKAVENENQSEIQINDSTPSKINIFTNLSFKTASNASTNNIFNIATVNSSNLEEQQHTNTTKLNSSDTVEEFEPNVEFKPVVPLPALIEQKTGEEDEQILFEHRAKLLRFDAPAKEWKERGLGNIKVLVHKNNNQKVRLIMRREQIMKVCCNHSITKEMTFQKMPNMDKAVTWCAKDFSEGELVAETFCLRFKTVQICDDFIEAIKTAQTNMQDVSKAAKEVRNAAEQVNQNKQHSFQTVPIVGNTNTSSFSGWGDKFKPKPGSWECKSCFVRNESHLENCSACNASKDPTAKKTTANNTSGSFTFGIPAQKIKSNEKPPIATVTGFGDKFKPKEGSWECKQCFVRNEAHLENCSACNASKDPTAKKTTTNNTSGSFTFGIPAQKIESNEKPPIATVTGFGDKFKPKEGSWECKQCFVRNESTLNNCCACNTPKNPSLAKDQNSSIFGTNTTMKFQFGIPPAQTNEDTKGKSMFDGTGGQKFNFSIPLLKNEESNNSKQITSLFNIQVSDGEGPINFSLKTKEDIAKTNTKPPLLPTPQKSESLNVFPNKETGKFSFVFKSAEAEKSDIKQDDSDGENYVKDEDCTAQFTPVIPMPDKVDVVTGEENEIELFAHKAKLYVFAASEWKERGTGIVKLLKHKETEKLRVVMRREQVLKICLNHALTAELNYTPKDEKSWIFVANDYSEGQINFQRFCLRFGKKETAMEFKKAVDNARNVQDKNDHKSDSGSDDVVFVSEIQASAEEKQKAKALMLPENFYTYKTKDPCQGCRGCQDDEKCEKPVSQLSKTPLPADISNFTNIITPLKTTVSNVLSPTNSIYGTPSNSDRTFDNSIFRTPQGSLGSETVTPTNNDTSNDINKENIFSQKFNAFGNIGTQNQPMFGTLQNNPVTIFGLGNAQAPVSIKSTVLAPPKLTPQAAIAEKQITAPKSIFSSSDIKPVFSEATSIFGGSGVSSNKSIFGIPTDNKQKEDSNTEKISIFGGGDQKPGNLFGNTQGSIFDTSFSQNAPKLNWTQNPSVFPINNQGSIWKTESESNAKSNLAAFTVGDNTNKSSEPKNGSQTQEPLFIKKAESNLSFANFAKSEAAGFEKKTDFQWEGAGQQLFIAKPKDGNKSNSETGAGDEEYDPHYEPIVPLPDEIVVTTGEEEEQKIFAERAKLFRYDDKTREWKERGVGEMKILYHPQRNTYRLLLRREQVYKAVLNMLVFMELDLLPMKNSDQAWTWVGRNYAESAAGAQETLAVKFKTTDLANKFREQVIQCVRKLQAAAAKAIREAKEAEEQASPGVALLRLPKHLENSARADSIISGEATKQLQQPSVETKTESQPNGEEQQAPAKTQVHFDPGLEEEHEQDYDEDEDDDEDYGEYNEDEENAYFACDGEVIVRQDVEETTCANAHILVMFDHDVCSPKILITDSNTGEILADMLIHTDTEFQREGDNICKWSGIDFTTNDPIDKSITVKFYDSDTLMEFYDSCETSKAATYSSTDPES